MVGAKPTAFITEPAHAVVVTNDRLVVITAPGAACSALATQESPLAGRRPSGPVSFAALADRDRNGSVEFAGRLKSRLALGLWSIKATCESRFDTYRGSQLIKSEMVRASTIRRVTVTLTSPG